MTEAEHKTEDLEKLNSDGERAPAEIKEGAAQATANRESLIEVAKETIKFIETAEKNKSIQLRINDRRSAIFAGLSFAICSFFVIMFLLKPETKTLCICLAFLADFLFGLAIVWYILQRFGVLRAMEPRYAILCWHLMLGSGMLFSFYTLNIMLMLLSFSPDSSLPPTLPD